MEKAVDRRLRRLQKLEARDALRFEQEDVPFSAVRERIPDGLREQLERAFRAGFRLVFEKGDGLIKKTYDANFLRREYAAHDRELRERVTGYRLYRLRARSREAVRGGMGLALAEGAALGVLGIGLPDIPLFLGGLLRGLYRIALSFGYDCRREGERCYLMLLIAASLSRGEERVRFAELAEQTARALDAGSDRAAALAGCIDAAAGCLAAELLTAKFVQGLPLVGIAGGLQNVPVYRRVAAYAARSYERRWLLGRDCG